MLPTGIQCGATGHPWGGGRAALHLVEEEVQEVSEWWLPRHAELPRSPGPAGCDVHGGSNETCREHARVFALLQQLPSLGNAWSCWGTHGSPPTRLPVPSMQG